MEEKKKSLKWLYWFSLGVAIIAVYKLLDNFGPITAWLAGLLNILMPFIWLGRSRIFEYFDLVEFQQNIIKFKSLSFNKNNNSSISNSENKNS